MGKLDMLWEYQLRELEKDALERELLNTPSRVKYNKLHAFLLEQQKTISRVQKELQKKQAVMENLTAKMAKFITNLELENSEYEGMLKDEECTAAEITECRENYEKLLRELNTIQRELSALTTSIDTEMKEYKKTRAKASEAKKEYDQLRVVCESELNENDGARKELDRKAESAAKKVDVQLLERYKRVKTNHAMPMAKVENSQCGGCNMSLPMVVIKRVQSSDDIVECENCGRILYTAE